MELLRLTLPTPEENLALDEALLLEAEAGRQGEVLRFWELPGLAVVLGSAGRLAEEVDEATCRADGVSILRRCSGGGAVLLGPGSLAYSLVLAMDTPVMRDVTHSYVYILKRMCQALAKLSPGLTCAGTSDLAIDGWKVSGNSQRRLRHYLLHHGTLLYRFNVARMARYLRMPHRQPAYRAGREHAQFVSNLPAEAPELERCLADGWQAEKELKTWPRDLVRQLVAEKYCRPEWIHRR